MSAVDPTLGLALCNAVTAFQACMACFAEHRFLFISRASSVVTCGLNDRLANLGAERTSQMNTYMLGVDDVGNTY